MDAERSEYINICADFLNGKSGNHLPCSLKAVTFKSLEASSPEDIAKMQVEALKKTLAHHSQEPAVFDRYLMLANCNSLDIAGNFQQVGNIRHYIEESSFMIKTLAKITENLDEDVSRMAPYEKQLFKLEQISHMILQNADFGVLAVDSQCKITIFNKAASTILGISQKIVGQNFDEAFSEMSSENRKFIYNCLFVEEASRKELTINGKKRVFELVSKILIDKKGKTAGAVLLIYDITANEQERKVLEESVKLAAVGKLAAGVAHEVKNPLTVIKGFSQLMLSKEYDAVRTASYLQLICQEVDRANQFIHDFLNLGRPQKPQQKVISAYTILKDTIALVESQCFINGVEIVERIDCPGEILVDPSQIKQVLINIIKNSLEAMEGSNNKKCLTFSLSKKNKSPTLLISIKDTGCGIPGEILDKVTTSFFTTKKYGTGLGLNISKAIVEQHDGELQFFSNCNGTTAIIHLPLLTEN